MKIPAFDLIRHYVHGDASETSPFKFYCASCDLFEHVDHFNDERHVATRSAKYKRSLANWRGITKNHPGRFRRPENAENCIADDAAADTRKSKAARAPFFVWLCKQDKRDDPVGDLSRDCQRDSSFPVSTTSTERLRAHLRRQNACDEALVALDEAIELFDKKPKGRVGISLAIRFQIFKRDKYCCQLCGGTAEDGKRLEVDHKLAVARGGANDISNLWTLCFECNRGKQTHEV
jgi:uncharacterized protein YozE (UPF0346 family)